MGSGIYIAAAGAIAQSDAMDATANNIANAGATGYHAERVSFREVLTKAKSPDQMMVQTNTGKTLDSQAGALMQTDNPLDLAIEGDGMFSVQTPQGMRYTRAGNFQLDSQGALVTQDGYKVLGEGGQPITLPPTATNIGVTADGSVSVDGQVAGKLQLVKFDGSQLKREGSTLFSANGKPQTSGTAPTVRSGMLESSNVNIVSGVVDLVKVQRNYESLMRVVQGFHDIDDRAAKELGGPR
ncbi:MAG TPA: flagellar basal-body rod protein FlgF [Kofleriaceae bacterium]|jgi:flagellar basal-body rod protein FlgF